MSALLHGALAGALVGLAIATASGACRRASATRVVGRLGSERTEARSGGPGWSVRGLGAPPAWLAARLEAAAPGTEPAVLVTAWAVAAPSLVLAGAVVGGAGLALCAVALAVLGPLTALAWRRGTADRVLEAALPDGLEAIARSLRSGAGNHQALAEAASSATGPLGHELATVVRELQAGAGFEVVLGDLERRRPVPGIRLAVAALLLGAEAGGAHARALDGVAESVRSRLGVSKEVRALSSQTRLSALVIACAPVAFAALAMGADTASATFLLGTPLGLACLSLGLSLDGVGAWWMHRIAEVDA